MSPVADEKPTKRHYEKINTNSEEIHLIVNYRNPWIRSPLATGLINFGSISSFLVSLSHTKTTKLWKYLLNKYNINRIEFPMRLSR